MVERSTLKSGWMKALHHLMLQHCHLMEFIESTAVNLATCMWLILFLWERGEGQATGWYRHLSFLQTTLSCAADNRLLYWTRENFNRRPHFVPANTFCCQFVLTWRRYEWHGCLCYALQLVESSAWVKTEYNWFMSPICSKLPWLKSSRVWYEQTRGLRSVPRSSWDWSASGWR